MWEAVRLAQHQQNYAYTYHPTAMMLHHHRCTYGTDAPWAQAQQLLSAEEPSYTWRYALPGPT
jgi:hypothetical protein